MNTHTPTPTHTHRQTLGKMTAQRGLRARGQGWCCVVCAYASVRKNLKRVLGSACVCMNICRCVRVCGLGVWSPARAWGEPADGWDEKRAAVFTLLWGLLMDTGTLPRPFSVTSSTHTPTHTCGTSRALAQGTESQVTGLLMSCITTNTLLTRSEKL